MALARAFVMQPDLLLFDEPLSNLDAKLRVQVRGELRRLQKRLGTTARHVTHDQDEAMSLSDRIAVMRDGRLEQIGTPEDVYARPATLFVAGFVGRVNALPGRVEGESHAPYRALPTETQFLHVGVLRSVQRVDCGAPRLGPNLLSSRAWARSSSCKPFARA